MINKDGGGTIFRFCWGHNCYKGGHIGLGGVPSPAMEIPAKKILQ